MDDPLGVRIGRVERQNLYLKIMMALMAGAVLLSKLTGNVAAQAKEAPKIVQAQAFVVLDKNGKPRGVLTGLGDDGPSLSFGDETVDRLKISSDYLGFKSAGGKLTACLICVEDGSLFNIPDNPKGKGGITLQKDGLRLADDNGRVRAALVRTSKGDQHAFFAIADADGNPVLNEETGEKPDKEAITGGQASSARAGQAPASDGSAREYDAATKLRLAYRMLDDAMVESGRGNASLARELKEKAQTRLQAIVQAHPGTQAARDAQDLLDGKKPPRRPLPPAPSVTAPRPGRK